MTQEPQIETFGKFTDPIPNTQESLTITFSPSTAPRKKRWQTAGLSADFLGDYFASFFPGDDLPDSKIDKRDAVKGNISFIANELLENAIKYSDETVKFPVSISLYLYDKNLVFLATNCASHETAHQYKEFIQEVVTTDIEELYSQQLEKAALGGAGSGMGLLTMINDYSADLGWKFLVSTDSPQMIQVTIMVQLEI